jgi:O-acetyl-ADP-ribose deacetylase (regulator of RNase III)
MTKITLLRGDITTQTVDAIVNAANMSLLGGGGVDGAIHRAAGPKLLEACKALGGCEVSDAKITKGFALPAKYIIHTVGPIYGNEDGKEAKLLADCYIHSLFLAKKYQCKTIAFPAIATGVYGYPKEAAAKIVYETVTDFITHDPYFDEIRFVLHSEEDFTLYKRLFHSQGNSSAVAFSYFPAKIHS